VGEAIWKAHSKNEWQEGFGYPVYIDEQLVCLVNDADFVDTVVDGLNLVIQRFVDDSKALMDAFGVESEMVIKEGGLVSITKRKEASPTPSGMKQVWPEVEGK
jgi:predicted PolB exonuclease-like 3'-5' exonuclease